MADQTPRASGSSDPPTSSAGKDFICPTCQDNYRLSVERLVFKKEKFLNAESLYSYFEGFVLVTGLLMCLFSVYVLLTMEDHDVRDRHGHVRHIEKIEPGGRTLSFLGVLCIGTVVLTAFAAREVFKRWRKQNVEESYQKCICRTA